MKYLSLTLMFCFLAFFSCEREDAFPETYGPVEAVVKHLSLATDAYADMALVSAILQDRFKDLSSITEEDVIRVATETEVDLEAIGNSLYEEFAALIDQGLTEEEAAFVMAKDQALAPGVLLNKVTPCYDSYITSTVATNAAAATCLGIAVWTVNPIGAGACAVAHGIASIVNNVNFRNCLKNRYPNSRP